VEKPLALSRSANALRGNFERVRLDYTSWLNRWREWATRNMGERVRLYAGDVRIDSEEGAER
jgi:hypothetical protein